MKWILFITGCLVSKVLHSQSLLKPYNGLLITKSASIIAGNYLLEASANVDSAVIVIAGDNIVVDFAQATLLGSDLSVDPDLYKGCAVLVKGGSNITIRNLRVHGYKVGIRAVGVKNLVIENCDASHNYRKRLLSNWKREDISDWMSYHHNEQDEWLRYGAAIYLRNCNNAVIKNNTVTNGQCALMMTACHSAKVYNNRFVFNSAIGIGMYRSSFCQILYNQLDFNVRGYSHGVYWRGQDSAGILVFEQCNHNVFEGNSATHSGDGFFLWAGQATMDTGTGGCNDNLLFQNDFSYAPTNGIEATFSRNDFISNVVKGCDHGLWGGYSYGSHIQANIFEANRIGIAIEHGHYNHIVLNQFSNNKTAIRLWGRKEQPSDWVYPKIVDARSRHYVIAGNTFKGDETVYDISFTDSSRIDFNKKSFSNNKTILKRGGDGFRLDTLKAGDYIVQTIAGNSHPADLDKKKVKPMPAEVQDRAAIRMMEWGPYDYDQPMTRLIKKDANGLMQIEFYGKPGNLFRIDSMVGVKEISAQAGSFPDTLLVRPSAQHVQIFWSRDFAELKGEMFTIKEYNVFDDFSLKAQWTMEVFPFTHVDSLKNVAAYFKKIISAPGIPVSNTTPDVVWWSSPAAPIPNDSFVTIATTAIDVPAAQYRLGVTADDMVRIYVDDSLVIDHWNKPGSAYDDDLYHETMLPLNGKHKLRIEHAEIGGLAVLQFYLNPVAQKKRPANLQNVFKKQVTIRS